MFLQKLSLLRPADAGMPCGLALVFLLLLGLLSALGRTPGTFFWVVFALAMVASAGCLWFRMSQRYERLRNGHCPYPMCSGAVQHSPRAHRGLVICPTCGREWPNIQGIHFRLTHHE